MATIREIAEKAGVSRGTVDRVLNHRGGVNPETEKKISEIAEALQYRSNRAAFLSNKEKSVNRIGIILTGKGNSFFDDVIDAIRQEEKNLDLFGYSVDLRNIRPSVTEQLNAIDELCEAGIKGLILSPCNDERIRRQIDRLSEKGIPVITTNTDINNSSRIAYVGSDDYKGGTIAAGLMGLITGGCATVGILTGSSQILCHSQRIQGFIDHLAIHYPKISVAVIEEHLDDEFESYRKTMDLLKEHPDIDALFFSAGGVLGGSRAVNTMGKKGIPFICFDLPEQTREMMQESIVSAAICQEPQTQGALPLRLMYEYLDHRKKPEKESYYVELSIRIRECF